MIVPVLGGVSSGTMAFIGFVSWGYGALTAIGAYVVFGMIGTLVTAVIIGGGRHLLSRLVVLIPAPQSVKRPLVATLAGATENTEASWRDDNG